MDVGVSGVEFETHGRIASAVTRNGGIRAIIAKKTAFTVFQQLFDAIDGLSPTGC
jgi:hypothetical protein